MVWEGDNIIATTRKMIGATDPAAAEPGTFRGEYGLSKQRNGVHGSDSVESSDREIALWFSPNEIVSNFESVSEPWVYEPRAPAKPKEPTSARVKGGLAQSEAQPQAKPTPAPAAASVTTSQTQEAKSTVPNIDIKAVQTPNPDGESDTSRARMGLIGGMAVAAVGVIAAGCYMMMKKKQ